MDIITLQDARLLAWAGERLNVKFPAEARTIAAISSSEILAVVVYSRFSPNNCEMSIASTTPKWCTKAFLRAAFTYPFRQLGLRRVTIVTTPNNVKAIDMILRLGAKQEGVLRDWFGDSDGLLFGMTAEEGKKWTT